MTVQGAKLDIALRTRRGLSNLLACYAVWVVLAVAGFLQHDARQLAWLYAAASVALLPLSLAACRLTGAELFPRGNPFTGLYLVLSDLQVIFAPVLVGAALVAPQLVPWFFGLVLGVRFLLLAWLLNSSAYLFCALGSIEVAVLTGWLTPTATYVTTSWALVAVLLISVYFLVRENAASHRGITPPGARSRGIEYAMGGDRAQAEATEG